MNTFMKHMSNIRSGTSKRIAVVTLFGFLATACIPPTFFSAVSLFSLEGDDVPFIIKVANDPSSVTCFDGTVTMDWIDVDTYQGTALYPANLSVGDNKVNCTAVNGFGQITSDVGIINVIENIPPSLVMLTTQTVCPADGLTGTNTPLVDTGASTNMDGAVYTLSVGTLRDGVSINSTNGNVSGTPIAGDSSDAGLTMEATTLAGSDTATFQIDYLTTCL